MAITLRGVLLVVGLVFMVYVAVNNKLHKHTENKKVKVTVLIGIIPMVLALIPVEWLDQPMIFVTTCETLPTPTAVVDTYTPAPTETPTHKVTPTPTQTVFDRSTPTLTSTSVPTSKMHGWDGHSYQYIYFGEYWQTADKQKQPILWRILGKHENKYFLVQSEYILEYMQVANTKISNWNDSKIIPFLNSTEPDGFLGIAFDDKEKIKKIYKRTDYWKVFILDESNILRGDYGLSDENNRLAAGTDYANANIEESAPVFYWLRKDNAGMASGFCGGIDPSGKYYKDIDYSTLGGVRPALYLDCTDLFNAGSGTKDDPFRFEE